MIATQNVSKELNSFGQHTQSVTWHHEAPITGNERNSAKNQITTGEWTQLDPLGVDAWYYNKYADIEEPERDWPRFMRGRMSEPGGGCSVDGMSAPCDYAAQIVNMGAGVQVFSTERGMTRVRNGQVQILTAFGDGHFGFVPMGATSDGSGGIIFPHGSEAARGDMEDIRLNHEHDGTPMRAHAGPPQNSRRTPQTACHVMADIAQDVADIAIIQNPDDEETALDDFDTRFSLLYVGGTMKNKLQAIDMAILAHMGMLYPTGET